MRQIATNNTTFCDWGFGLPLDSIANSVNYPSIIIVIASIVLQVEMALFDCLADILNMPNWQMTCNTACLTLCILYYHNIISSIFKYNSLLSNVRSILAYMPLQTPYTRLLWAFRLICRIHMATPSVYRWRLSNISLDLNCKIYTHSMSQLHKFNTNKWCWRSDEWGLCLYMSTLFSMSWHVFLVRVYFLTMKWYSSPAFSRPYLLHKYLEIETALWCNVVFRN